MIETKHPEISVVRQCELLGLNRSTLYYQSVAYDEITFTLLNKIDEYYTAHPEYGTRTMQHYLRSIGYPVNRKRIQRLYKILDIQAIYKKPKTSITNKAHTKYPYLLGGMDVLKKNQAWCTDITYIRMKRGFMYLVAIMDWHSRFIISWSLSPFLDTQFCVDALNEALAVGECEIFNSDQGAQFTSEQFTRILLHKNIKISMAGKGRCYDNILIERFWRSLKHNYVYLHQFENVKELMNGLRYWINFYNQERVHQALNYKTPAMVYEGDI